MTGNDIKDAPVLRRRHVTLERLATWIGFAGAVVLQSSALLLCFQAVSDKFGVGSSLTLPAVIALGGLAMIGGGRLVARRSRLAFALQPRLRLVGENRPELVTEARRRTA